MAELLCCSFCGRSRMETRKLVDSPGCMICLECVTLCAELIAAEDRADVVKLPQPSAPNARVEPVNPQILDHAIAELLRILEEEPGDIRTRLKLSDLYIKRNDIKRAVKQYALVAARYAADGMPLKAVAVYKQMLKLSEAEGVHGKLGELYERLGLLSDARLQYETQASICERAGDPGAAAAIRQRITAVAGGTEGEATAARISPVLACTLCGKPQHSVKKLIAGPNVYICNECVAVCVDTISKD